MINAIIFDCFGVLTVTELWKDFITSLPEEQRAEASELNRAHDANRITLAEYRRAIHELTGHEPAVIETLTDSSKMQKNMRLFEYISSLKPTYKIGLLSNVGSDWVTDVFLSAEEQRLFDAIVLSHNVGLIKPDAAIFELIAEKLSVKPKECIFVDDGEHNCEGAKRVGMQAVVYEDFIQCKEEIERILES